MASLTQASGSSPASATLPSTLEMPNVDHLTGSDTQLVDLNLSRCTTPVSLIQPDSVDICEFLANRDENESEISIDDLFLASGALDDSNFKMNEKVSMPSSSTDARDTSRSGRDSVDTDATDALHGENFDHEIPSAPDLVTSANTPSSESLKNALIDLESWPVGVTKAAGVVLPQSSAKTKSKTNSFSHSGRRNSLIQESTPVPEPVSVSETDDLFGLPWEDQDLLLDCPTSQNVVGSADDSMNDFNAGLLPIQKRATSRIQIIPQSDPSTFSPPRRRDSSSDHSVILGNEIIPAEAAVPFANVAPTNLVHLFQPTAKFISAPTRSSLPQATSISTATTKSSVSISPPVIVGRCQSRIPPTIAPRTTITTVRSNACLVSTASSAPLTNTPTLVPQPVSLAVTPTMVPLIRQIQPISNTTTQPTSPLITKPLRRSTLRPIAPAVKSSPRITHRDQSAAHK
ncbi:hypothetical protein P879_10523 [Paragonimus westermani]|uniref:Uncharacterized protein n=1 Tax=Paragonimus westermani TaxID=34504 RepID=A0A8T0DB70_9TREM|nr:hypothetical protein P879_10523 [Paragonimus westermani]